ncbi:DUF3775 domain-containing protein [Nostoc sp. C052]|uniref:DUF3775 domain-containing protein n=1 Tax=Nostoc sp. C052 TaxID=2576902 RepID=UPI0015C3E4B7|nr:DUF3775 domain-containing protein [Nostoc sp. C052]QLE41707.1 DUF3775 domain-containing protein [Nostoc sp. C052]
MAAKIAKFSLCLGFCLLTPSEIKNMSLLSINKIYNVIKIAELVYGSIEDEIKKQPETFVDKLSNYLQDFNITGRYSLSILHKYINEFSEEEKAEVIALMWLGRSISHGQLEDFPNFVKKVLEIVPKNQATSYILERPLLAKYLRDGLQKLDISTFALS